MSINLGLSHLRAVVGVADAGSFTAAAAHLHVVQSSLSRTVADAERRLQIRLFVRTTRSVELTVEGREVVEVARHMLEEFDSGLRHVTGYLDGSRGTLTIAALPALAATLLPGLLSSYRSTRPDVTVRVLDMLSTEILHHVLAGSVDIAVTGSPSPHPDLVVQPVATDSFFCAAPVDHRFARSERVTWSDLAGEAFIAFDPATTSVRLVVDRAILEAGIGLGPVLEARTVGAVAGLTAAGLGVTVVPGFVLPMIEFAGLRHILLEPEVQRSICIVRHRRRPLSPTVQGFLDTVRTAATSEGPLPAGASWHVTPPTYGGLENV
ncbi:LysR family transcriptional regulator [Blastococcus capsensis]|uniref:LysR family transcriptional regulator n=1 Tax=Blastococcus capsensis TaxID=1564163 RepID=UPI0025412290|nr:LysR family transcriptional regulator [Blastococcus capsensis]MDK3257775.1 LysR family transcriptional regulator [Blastococcus capsensis]